MRPERDWSLLGAMQFLFMFGFMIYMGVFTNFFKDAMGTDPLKMGALESMREVPGLIAALMAGAVVALAESRVAVIGLAITGAGIAVTGMATGYWPLVGVTVFWSIGFHLWSTVSPSMVLALSSKLESGRRMGQMRSIGSIATIVALGLAAIAARSPWKPPYGVYFGVGGVCIVAAAVLAAFLSPAVSHGARERFIFRREYGLYYWLMFLEGCRRQIFSIFALFTLITVYQAPLELILAISFLNAILTTVTSPRMGKYIDRVGERKPLTIYAAGIILIFLGYATIPNAIWLYVLYVVDNVLFTFSIGFNTYLHRIVRPGETTPCLAMGTTMNHVAAVSLPVIGAYIWKASGNYQIPFAIGVGLAILALISTRWLPTGAPVHD